MARSYTPYHPGLLTDLYHPDSVYVAWRRALAQTTFDLYARRAPFGGAYLLVAGLEMALEFVRSFPYTDEDLAFLAQIRDYEPRVPRAICGGLRFTGEILAMPEGSIAFPNEPLLRVTAPFSEALLLESGLLQAINLATLIATKASRVVWAARGRPVAEFSLRRAQDPYVATRSSRIGGCFSTSFLGAAYRFRLPSTGTVPHALIQLFDTEREAFEAIADTYNRYTLLLDTYDPRAAIHTAVEVAQLGARSARPRAGRGATRQRRPGWRRALRARRARRGRPGRGQDRRVGRPRRVLDHRPDRRRARRSTRLASAPAWAWALARSSATSRAPRWAASTRRCSTWTSAGGIPRSRSPAKRARGRASKRCIASATSSHDVDPARRRAEAAAARATAQAGRARRRGRRGLVAAAQRDLGACAGQPAPFARAYRQLGRARPYPVHFSEGISARCATHAVAEQRDRVPSRRASMT